MQFHSADAASSEEHAAAVAACPRRIYAPTADGTIVAVNADDGSVCTSFGDHGAIDLKRNQGKVAAGVLNPTSPPLVTRHVLIAAASVTDNDSTDEPSGVVRGYDIDTGKLLWNWDSGNPDATAPIADGATYTRNSPNMWSVASADESLGLVYLPMGNQTPDIWGGNRIPNGERFNSAIVALEIATGRVSWVYQSVHHDIWDMDVGGQPSLVDLDTPRGKVTRADRFDETRRPLRSRSARWLVDRTRAGTSGAARRRRGRSHFADAAFLRAVVQAGAERSRE